MLKEDFQQGKPQPDTATASAAAQPSQGDTKVTDDQ